VSLGVRFIRFTVGAAALAVSCAFVPLWGQTPPPDYELQKQWEVPFGLFRNWVLCPDGSLYSVADKQGGIRRTSSNGKTDPEDTGQIGTPALLLTCDQKDQLYVASKKDLDIYALDAQGKLIRAVSARERFFIEGAVVTPDSNLYVLSEDDSSAPVIRQLSADGRVLRKFSKGYESTPLFPLIIFPFPQPLTNYPHRVFDWNEDQHQFVVSLGGISGFQSMDMNGHWKRAKYAVSTGYGAPGLVSLDRIFSWKGQYIAQVTFKSEIADVFNVTKLELLDKSFQVLWSRKMTDITTQPGLLVGAAADGSLYFLTFNGTDCMLARYVLAPAEQAASN